MKNNKSIISYEKLLSSLLNTNIIYYAEVSILNYISIYTYTYIYLSELSVQALKLELPMFKNHFNYQSLKEAVENVINAKDCLKELFVSMYYRIGGSSGGHFV